MDFDFDQIYSLIEKMNKSDKEKCLICHLPVDNDELILTCNHYYHSKCLNLKKKSGIKCPYCEKTVSIKLSKTNDNSCKVIIKTGIRKGQYCGRNNCVYHKLAVNKITIIHSDTCQAILKSGLKAGQLCGRLNCKIHNH